MFILAAGNVMTGQSPAQASVAPSPLRQEPQAPQPSMGAPYALPQPTQTTQDKQDTSKTLNVNRYPVVKLGRLSVSPSISLFSIVFIDHRYNVQIRHQI